MAHFNNSICDQSDSYSAADVFVYGQIKKSGSLIPTKKSRADNSAKYGVGDLVPQPPSVDGFQHENVIDVKSTFLGTDTYSINADDINIIIGILNANAEGTAFTRSQTLDHFCETPESQVSCFIHNPCSESQAADAYMTNGSRSYNFIPVHTTAQVDGIPLVRDEWIDQAKVVENTKTWETALPGTENLAYTNTELQLQTECNDDAFLNISAAVIPTLQSSEPSVQVDELQGIDASLVTPIVEEGDILSINDEQCRSKKELTYPKPPSPKSLSQPHTGHKKFKFQEESSAQDSGNDDLPSKNEKARPKLHEIEHPLPDTQREKRRRDAIRAKRTRERRKNDIKQLETELNRLKKVRASLLLEVGQLKGKEKALEEALLPYQSLLENNVN